MVTFLAPLPARPPAFVIIPLQTYIFRDKTDIREQVLSRFRRIDSIYLNPPLPSLDVLPKPKPSRCCKTIRYKLTLVAFQNASHCEIVVRSDSETCPVRRLRLGRVALYLSALGHALPPRLDALTGLATTSFSMNSRAGGRPGPRRRQLSVARPVGSTSLPASASGPPTPSSAPTVPAQSSTFFFTGWRNVWAGLKATAALEVGGFVKGLNGGAPDEADGAQQQQHAKLGDKRAGDERDKASRNGPQQSRPPKKRRVVRAGDAFLFDGGEPSVPCSDCTTWTGSTYVTDVTRNSASADAVHRALQLVR